MLGAGGDALECVATGYKRRACDVLRRSAIAALAINGVAPAEHTPVGVQRAAVLGAACGGGELGRASARNQCWLFEIAIFLQIAKLVIKAPSCRKKCKAAGLSLNCR